MFIESCTWITFSLIFIGSLGNILCICVFLRKRFRSSILTPFFVALLITDCIYLMFRVIKLLYYQETLFEHFSSQLSCSLSLFIRIYSSFARNAPQILIPLSHYELYIRFTLILMASLAIQRAYDMCRISFRLIKRTSSSRSLSFILIISTFIIAYLLEFFGLSIFCSYELSSKTTYQWYNYLHKNLSNETISLINFMRNQSASEKDINCISNNNNNNSSCTHEEIAHITRHYFDIHQRPIVELIRKIHYSSIGTKIARNELRLKYHYHTCLIRLQPDLFLKLFDVLYSRTLGFNRYTLILVIGSIIPSIITILGNTISLRWILNIRNSVYEHSAIFRRTDETRRVIIIITVECLLAVINSWLVDIILSIVFCKWSVAIGDDCPEFLEHYHPLLAFFDLLNSMSNIVLYCFATKRFRRELECMLKGWINTIRQVLKIICKCEWTNSSIRRKKFHDEHSNGPTETSLQVFKSSKRFSKKYDYIKIKIVSTPDII
ncbi:unnamed protein product [Adineta steineri]|uniref:G-protein coupled receptors family 1 profile domain-containing protein n=1 Tax=Adineta steineri TaxID=433720 RepID=A0A818SIU7_9BILA|nr:unnamed protein product [Adineta steineri]CAF3669691.1 unnamed protein product [Adineta steineri]